MLELHITYDETNGNVNVNGPINNKGICYLMLECARDAVKDHTDQAQRMLAVPAGASKDNGSTGMATFLRTGRHKRRK